jgi:L-alanine-DL-glutamate epimerase-like enolase superfamily enzyme
VKVEDVDVVVAAVPVAAPIRLGDVVIREREYAVLRLRTDEGIDGTALGYTRGLPVAEALERLAPSLVGRDALRRSEILESLRAANPFGASQLVRALSLVEIALWDVLARAAELPLWRLLGGARQRVPLLAVGGYFGDAEEELRRLAAEGFGQLKVHLPVDWSPEGIARLCRAAEPASLAIDLHMGFRDLAQALETCRRLDGLGLAFLEDPFPPSRWRLTVELQSRLATPVAAGEDATPEELRALAETVTVLRVDATTSGGIDAIAAAAAVAHGRGAATMTHAFLDLHGQIAGGVAAIGLAEVIHDDGANPVGALLARRQRIESGELVLDDEPGHGFPLDWSAVERYARR